MYSLRAAEEVERSKFNTSLTLPSSTRAGVRTVLGSEAEIEEAVLATLHFGHVVLASFERKGLCVFMGANGVSFTLSVGMRA